MLWKSAALPITFPGIGNLGGTSSGGLASIVCGMTGVTNHVSGPGGVTRSAGRETSGTFVGFAGSGMAGQCGGSR